MTGVAKILFLSHHHVRPKLCLCCNKAKVRIFQKPDLICFVWRKKSQKFTQKFRRSKFLPKPFFLRTIFWSLMRCFCKTFMPASNNSPGSLLSFFMERGWLNFYGQLFLGFLASRSFHVVTGQPGACMYTIKLYWSVIVVVSLWANTLLQNFCKFLTINLLA